jgi:hypothetical protein
MIADMTDSIVDQSVRFARSLFPAVFMGRQEWFLRPTGWLRARFPTKSVHTTVKSGRGLNARLAPWQDDARNEDFVA